ncbi:HupE/UreJ family protein [Bradyrhizobium sp. UFLA05-153]|uniref:HupE/UreJ family protein n=1 Tax=Bradyrhizobium sp. Ec3.3 TaxID=189753 RepID=UPI000428522F|nr:HupE/UreJ family protein [Bradyrhizobium sp. Ec3.3]
MQSLLVCMVLANILMDPASAHLTIGDTHSFVAGIIHPLTGIDHTSVMALVGLWGALVGGRAIWAWPLIFVAAMLIGFAAAAWGLQIALIEPAIAASIVVFGVLVALRVRLPVILGAAIVGLFALFHGHAHGTEAAASNLASYAAGFTVSTASLHSAGIAMGLCIRRLVEKIASEWKRRLSTATRIISGGELQ